MRCARPHGAVCVHNSVNQRSCLSFERNIRDRRGNASCSSQKQPTIMLDLYKWLEVKGILQ